MSATAAQTVAWKRDGGRAVRGVHTAPQSKRQLCQYHHQRHQGTPARAMASYRRLRRGRMHRTCIAFMEPTGHWQEIGISCPWGRNILVAADSSQDSKYALQWTAQELCFPGDVVHVAHCIPYLLVTAGMYALPDSKLAMLDVDRLLAGGEEQYLLTEQRELQRTCEAAFGGQEVAHVVTILREDPLGSGDKGRIAEALCRKAEALQASVLVVASQTRGGLPEFLLGSVAAHCTAHCRRPVLVLHAPEGQDETGGQHIISAATPMLAGAIDSQQSSDAAAGKAKEQQAIGGSGTCGASCKLARNIVLAVDDSEESERACTWALGHLYRPGDTFHLLRIIPALQYREACGGSPVFDGTAFCSPQEPLAQAFKSAAEMYIQHRFEPQLQAMGVPYQVNVIVEATDGSVPGVGEAICRKAEELQAAAVVLGSHMSGGLLQLLLGSVASYVWHRCQRPVAVLH